MALQPLTLTPPHPTATPTTPTHHPPRQHVNTCERSRLPLHSDGRTSSHFSHCVNHLDRTGYGVRKSAADEFDLFIPAASEKISQSPGSAPQPGGCFSNTPVVAVTGTFSDVASIQTTLGFHSSFLGVSDSYGVSPHRSPRFPRSDWLQLDAV